ncbi:MAG: cytochrome C biogenesis protein, partial [Oceanospirillum sp.]|nr:cytochrome C biogenesis protein [Oceanospirillum sp.]
GHRWLGWRGMTAVRWTLGGATLLILGYFGSKVALEVLLN